LGYVLFAEDRKALREAIREKAGVVEFTVQFATMTLELPSFNFHRSFSASFRDEVAAIYRSPGFGLWRSGTTLLTMCNHRVQNG
jgi:hypothetical protein